MRRAFWRLKLVAAIVGVLVAILWMLPVGQSGMDAAAAISSEAWLASGTCLVFSVYLVATRRRASETR